MKLYGSETSPYVRKLRILIREKEIPCEFIIEGPSDPAGHVAALNPLGKVPVLVRDQGDVLFDSPMIAEYLDSLRGEPLLPLAGEARWVIQRWHALGQGIMDAVVARMLELRKPADKQTPGVVSKQEGKIAAALKYAEANINGREFLVDDHFGLADIALGTALGYVDFRYAHDWRAGHPRLANWLAQINKRPSFVATLPPAA
jgi:glutathione S-transferase